MNYLRFFHFFAFFITTFSMRNILHGMEKKKPSFQVPKDKHTNMALRVLVDDKKYKAEKTMNKIIHTYREIDPEKPQEKKGEGLLKKIAKKIIPQKKDFKFETQNESIFSFWLRALRALAKNSPLDFPNHLLRYMKNGPSILQKGQDLYDRTKIIIHAETAKRMNPTITLLLIHKHNKQSLLAKLPKDLFRVLHTHILNTDIMEFAYLLHAHTMPTKEAITLCCVNTIVVNQLAHYYRQLPPAILAQKLQRDASQTLWFPDINVKTKAIFKGHYGKPIANIAAMGPWAAFLEYNQKTIDHKLTHCQCFFSRFKQKSSTTMSIYNDGECEISPAANLSGWLECVHPNLLVPLPKKAVPETKVYTQARKYTRGKHPYMYYFLLAAQTEEHLSDLISWMQHKPETICAQNMRGYWLNPHFAVNSFGALLQKNPTILNKTFIKWMKKHNDFKRNISEILRLLKIRNFVSTNRKNLA